MEVGQTKMPNDILRAGPFGQISGGRAIQYHVQQPEVGEESNKIAPINCAMNNWSNDTWKLMCQKGFTTGSPPYGDGSIEYISATFPLSQGEKIEITEEAIDTGTDPNGFAGSGILFRFMTQATAEFDIKVIAEAVGDFSTLSVSGADGVQFGTGSRTITTTVQPSSKPKLFTAGINTVDAAPTSVKLTIEAV